MSRHVAQTTEWVYRGIWGVVTNWFRVPAGPPPLPLGAGSNAKSFRPSPGFLRYLKFQFWCLLLAFDIAVLAVSLVLAMRFPVIAPWLIPLALIVAVVPDIIAYVAIHLRYDTTWYITTDRSLRIRRGIWEIHETTITFENVQNVSVESGPIERFFWWTRREAAPREPMRVETQRPITIRAASRASKTPPRSGISSWLASGVRGAPAWATNLPRKPRGRRSTLARCVKFAMPFSMPVPGDKL
jgi:hypothetical protein